MPIESRLASKFKPKLLSMLKNIKAKSVEYELVKTVFTYFSDDSELKALAIERLKIFLASADPNLKFLGL